MNKAKIADLKNNLSRYLAYVREGGEVLVLDRDTPVARIVPFAAPGNRGQKGAKDRSAGALAELERQGIIKRGNPGEALDWLDTHKPVKLPPGSGSVSQTLLEMRDEDTR